MAEENPKAESLNLSLQKVLPSFALFLFIMGLALRPLATGLLSGQYSNVHLSLFMVIGAFFYLSAKLLRGKLPLGLNIPLVLIFIYFSIAYIGCFHSDNHGASFDYAADLFIGLIVFCTSAFLIKKDELFGIFSIFSAAAWICFIFGIYQYYVGLDLTRDMIEKDPAMLARFGSMASLFKIRLYSQEAFATFITPNVFGIFIIIFIPFLLEPILQHLLKGRMKPALVALLPLSFYLYLLSLAKSKGAWLCCVVLFFLYFCRLLWLKKIIGKKIIVAGSILSIFLLLYAIWYSAGAPNSIGSSVTVRLNYWEAGLKIIKEHWLWGTGLNTFGDYYAKYKTLAGWEVQKAHNWIIQSLSDVGIVASLFLVLFFIKILLLKPAEKTGDIAVDTISLPMRLSFGVLFFSLVVAIYPLVQVDKQYAPARIFVLLGCGAGVPYFLRYLWGGLNTGSFFAAVKLALFTLLLHGLIDIDFLDPTIIVTLFFFCGILVNCSDKESCEALRPGLSLGLLGLTVIAFILFFVHYFVNENLKTGLEISYEDNINKKEYARALIIGRQIIKYSPQDSRVYSQQGSLLLSMERVKAAVACFRNEVKYCPNASGPRIRLAKTLMMAPPQQQPYQEIIKHIKIAIENYPLKPQYYILLAQVMVKTNKLVEARQNLESALEIHNQITDERARLQEGEVQMLKAMLEKL